MYIVYLLSKSGFGTLHYQRVIEAKDQALLECYQDVAKNREQTSGSTIQSTGQSTINIPQGGKP